MKHHYSQIAENPHYKQLVRARTRYGWILTSIMFIVYFGYIFLVAFNKDFLAQSIGSGVTTLSIPVGLGVIVFTVILTGIYVRRANSEFDALNEAILKDLK
jgi:uncharacterized membrane protein (DUF485 family)